MSYNLNGRVAIITGATGGIGRAIASEFYSLGAALTLTGRDIEKLSNLRNDLIASGNKAPAPLCVFADLTAIGVESHIIQQTVEHFGRLDILVNNAAMVEGCFFVKTDEPFLTQMMHTNFTAPYNLARAAIPRMLKNKYGRIICITSVAGYMGDAGMSAYAASKGAIASAAKSIAVEYGRRGITANCIAPGIVDTPATKKLPIERQKELKNMIPARRFAHPEEIAHLAAFLASDHAAYINGQQIHINGGLTR